MATTNEMCSIPNRKDQFTAEDFNDILTHYSNYSPGELKDYMLIYLSDEEYANFNLFFGFLRNPPQLATTKNGPKMPLWVCHHWQAPKEKTAFFTNLFNIKPTYSWEVCL
jgi:hypothetical protein